MFFTKKKNKKTKKFIPMLIPITKLMFKQLQNSYKETSDFKLIVPAHC